MKVKVELTLEELEESNFTDEQHMRECLVNDLDNARDYPGFNIDVIVTKE